MAAEQIFVVSGWTSHLRQGRFLLHVGSLTGDKQSAGPHTLGGVHVINHQSPGFLTRRGQGGHRSADGW